VRFRSQQTLDWKYVSVVRLAQHVPESIWSVPCAAKALIRPRRTRETVGVGIEYGFAPNWSVAIEYDHLFMGRSSNNVITPAGVFDRTESVRQDIDMGTVRLNYTFGGPVVARY
jgi:hypothetical protein